MSNESSLWLTEHQKCVSLGQEIMALVNQRHQATTNTVPHNKLTTEIHSMSRQFSSKVSWLQEDLLKASRSYQITERESERRQFMVDKLQTKYRQIEHSSSADSTKLATVGRFASSHNPFDEATDNAEDYTSMTHESFRQQQQRVFEEQDEGLESLSKVLSRQKQMAVDIGNEVDTQNEILEDIIDHTSRTDSRIKTETRHIKIVDRKSATCGFWVVIILLLIAIIVVVAIPK